MFAPNLARPRPVASLGAPTRPARSMCGFCVRQVSLQTLCLYSANATDNVSLDVQTRLAIVPAVVYRLATISCSPTQVRKPSPKLGKPSYRHFGRPRRQPSLYPSRVPQKTVLNVSSQARTKEILCKPLREQNVRLTRGFSPVYHRDRERSSLLAVDQCTDGHLSL